MYIIQSTTNYTICYYVLYKHTCAIKHTCVYKARRYLLQIFDFYDRSTVANLGSYEIPESET